jgi:hypothetical protein
VGDEEEASIASTHPTLAAWAGGAVHALLCCAFVLSASPACGHMSHMTASAVSAGYYCSSLDGLLVLCAVLLSLQGELRALRRRALSIPY